MSKKMWFVILFVVVIIVSIVAISNLNKNKDNQTNQTNQNSQNSPIDENQSITDINNKRIEDEIKMNPKTFEH